MFKKKEKSVNFRVDERQTGENVNYFMYKKACHVEGILILSFTLIMKMSKSGPFYDLFQGAPLTNVQSTRHGVGAQRPMGQRGPEGRGLH